MYFARPFRGKIVLFSNRLSVNLEGTDNEEDNIWRGGRVVEGARLESVCTPKGYRGFESLPLRHLLIFNLDFLTCNTV